MMKFGSYKTVGALVVCLCASFTQPASAQLDQATDVNPDPNIFEAYLTADEQDLTISGVTIHAMVYKDDPPVPSGIAPGIPAPEIKVKVGDLVIVHFRNDLASESASIHWHGIELDNDSDGTAVTQDAVLPGQSYTYRFRTFRPGLFWYHSHMLPGSATFAGMYGSIVIENNIESSLQGTVLPAAANTYSLVLSDIEFDAATGVVGKPLSGGAITPINELVELCHLFVENEPGGDMGACGSPTPGTTVLVNGEPPDAGAETPKFVVASGQRIRLRLFNAAITRHFRLKLLNSADNKLYRIGGEGGLLDNVQLDGGVKGTWDTRFDLGEIVIGSGERADVIIVPSGGAGDIVQLTGNPLPNPFNLSTGLPADYPLAFFEISGTSSDTPPAAGDPILAGTAEDIENLKDDPVIDPVVDPAPFGGSNDETIRLTNVRPGLPNAPSIDGSSAMLDSNVGNGDFLTLARPATSRYARVGDLLELSVRNETMAVHPFHMHGFSLQPVRVIDNASAMTLYEFDYDEFIDSIDVYGMQTLVYRARIDDRPKICDASPSFPPGPTLAACVDESCGGAVGRWLFHCHIFHHAGLGMMGEITVLELDLIPPEITCPADIMTTTDPGLCSAVVTFAPVATDNCGEPTVVCVPPSGSAFPKGTTTVTCTATDNDGLTAECTFELTVIDDEPPVVTSSVDVSMLWPPNHFMRNVGLSVTATDNCPGVVVSVAVFGNEDDEEQTGDGHHSPDALSVAPETLRLRAERKGNGDGRVYLIVVTATDESGNTAFSCNTVVVPQSRKFSAIAAVGAAAAAARAFCEANNGASPPGYVVVGDGLVIGPHQ
ncbi:MAG: multicopper oxidase domain-containing protein [Planctomycetota bacterium]